jgi:hypothetical protein
LRPTSANVNNKLPQALSVAFDGYTGPPLSADGADSVCGDFGYQRVQCSR